MAASSFPWLDPMKQYATMTWPGQATAPAPAGAIQPPAAIESDPNAGLRKAWAQQQALNTGLSVGATMAQYAAMALPTVQDTRNKEQLAKLGAAHDRGELADTPGANLITEATREQLAHAGAVAREMEQKLDQRLAAQGGTTSAQVAGQSAREANRARQEINQKIGSEAAVAKQVEMGKQIAEEESRTAYEAERQKGKRQFLAQTLAGLAPVFGQIRAAQAVKKFDWAAIQKANPNMTVGDQMLIMSSMGGQTSPEALASMLGRATKET